MQLYLLEVLLPKLSLDQIKTILQQILQEELGSIAVKIEGQHIKPLVLHSSLDLKMLLYFYLALNSDWWLSFISSSTCLIMISLFVNIVLQFSFALWLFLRAWQLSLPQIYLTYSFPLFYYKQQCLPFHLDQDKKCFSITARSCTIFRYYYMVALPLLHFLFLGLRCLFAIKYTFWLIIHYLFSIIHSNAVFSIRNDEKLSIFPLENITWPYLNSCALHI